MKLTRIFPANVKPVRKGVYKTGMAYEVYLQSWSYWDGKAWGYFERTPQDADRWKGIESEHQAKYWQGVLK